MRVKRSRFMYGLIALAVVTSVLVASGVFEDPYEQELEEGWHAFISGLEQAQDNLTALTALAPPTTERNLSDGYRYLMGHLVRVANYELNNNPLAPRFQRAVSFLSKWTGDNADAVYLIAPIDGGQQYRITGRVPYYRDNSASTLHDISEAPGLVLFAVNSELIGQTGSLQEMAECRSQTLSALDSFALQIEPDGSFEILLGPEKPGEYAGNFLDTEVSMTCKDFDGNTVGTRLRVAKNVVLRELFFDWERELSLDLDIVRVDHEGLPPKPVSTTQRRKQLANSGELVARQIEFWNYLQYVGLELYWDINFDGERRLPVNALNQPSPPFIAAGTAGARQLYAAGIFELEEDDALVVEVLIRDMPYYIGFHLSNVWMESLDQANYLSSRNHRQLEFDPAGNTYLVVSQRDPGVANWVDTTGLSQGAMNFRFYYEDEYEQERLPVLKASRVPVQEVAASLPEATRVSGSDRKREVAIRQKHIRQRLREY